MLIRTQILFPEEDLELLREIAVEKGISVSKTVRNLVKDRLKDKKKRNAVEVLLEAIEWTRKNKIAGPKDLGTNDEYLYGKLAPDFRK